MLEGLVEKLILSYFGDFIENLDRKKLSVGVWSGNLTLEDIVIRSKKINDLKLPFKLIYGRIGKLDIQIPWKSNFSSPTIINIETIQIVLSLINQIEWEFLDYISFDSKIAYLNKFAQNRIQELVEAFTQKDVAGSTYGDRVVLKILDNLHVNFKNIHVRIEEPNKNPLYSIGITLEEMLVVNTNENWEQKFIDRNVHKNIDVFKLLKISNFGVYLKTNENYFISKLSDTIKSEMEKLFPIGSKCANNIDYLIKPISLIAKMKQNNEISDITMAGNIEQQARVILSIKLEKFDIDIQKTQFDCIIRILNHISNYQRFQFNYFETRKFRAYKPKFKILDQINKPNEIKSKEIKNENALLWFKYAIQMVIKKIKFSRGANEIWDLPAILQDKHKENFEILFYKFYKNPDSLTADENIKFKEIIEIVEIHNLYLWVKPVIQGIYKKNKKEENKKAKTGFFKKMIGRKINDEDLLSKEEEEKIEEILENSVKDTSNQVINSDIETKLRIDFILNEGSFKFSKTYSKLDTTSTEGFAFKYKCLQFSMRKGEYFLELDSELKDFNVEMFTIINKNTILIPITFKTFQEEIKKNNLVRMDTNSITGLVSRTEKSESIVLENPPSIEEDFVWKLNFRKNAPNHEINSKLFLQVNTLNILYHQVLLERIIDFFKVNLTEDLASQAWDKLAEIKDATQESLKDALGKKNIIEMKIEPRKVIVPINKYDLKNSRILMVEIGKMTMYNASGYDMYPDRYNLDVSTLTLSHFNSFNNMRLNRDRFDLVTDTSARLGFAVLSKSSNYSPHQFPSFKLFIEIDNITVSTTEYLYTLLMYIIDIFKPAQEVDLWSQLNQDKNEIKKNCIVFGKVLKKNQLLRNWEEYYAVLSGGYIYFYKEVSDEEYSGYYNIKDSDLVYLDNNHTSYMNIEDHLSLHLNNKFGMIEIKFQNETKHKQWITALISRINEMKSSYDFKTEEYIKKQEMIIPDVNSIYFGMEINLRNVTAILYNEKNINSRGSVLLTSNFNYNNNNNNKQSEKENYLKSFTIQLTDLNLLLNLTDLDVYIGMSIRSLKVIDNLYSREEFKQILDSTDPDNKDLKLFFLEIFVSDEKSPKYKNIQIEINIEVGYLYAIWHPIVIRRLLSYLAHNDILRNKILREIQLPIEKLLEENFIEPVKETLTNRVICSESRYTYIKLNTKLKKVRVVWIQPILNFMYTEVRLADANLDFDMKVDHFVLVGELGNTQVFDLSNYPFTIRNQDMFNPLNIKEILGAKENSKSLITFQYTSKNIWCPLCQDNYTSEAIVKINSITLLYIQEHFLRFFNYLFGEFLGSLGPNDEVKKFRNEKNQIKIKNDANEIEFIKLKVILNNPQAILKPRFHFKEHFLVDFGKVTITCEYSKTEGRLRNQPKEWRWINTYHFKIKNFVIKTSDNFSICDPTTGFVNMHFINLTEEDKKLSDLEFDKSFQIDVFFNSFNVNLRQIDFMNIMKLNDLNIVYTDEQYDDYNYEKLYQISADPFINVGMPQNNKNNVSKSEEDILMEKYNSIFVVLIISKISLKLYIEDQIFSELSLNEKQLNFYKKLNNKKEINICVSSMEAFHFINDTNKEIILSDFIQPIYDFDSPGFNSMMKTNNDDEIKILDEKSNRGMSVRRNTAVIDVSFNTPANKIMPPFTEKIYKEFKACKLQTARITETKTKQLDLKIVIDSDREKTYMITLNGLKLVLGYTTITLIKQFFLEGFPYYDNKDDDLPNLYDPNEENNPGMRVYLEIKNPLICLLSEDISAQDQDIICLSTEIVVGYKKEKVSKIKNELLTNYNELTNLKLFVEDDSQKEHLNNAIINDKSDTYSTTVSLFEVCPFITNMRDVLFSEHLVIPKRKIMDNFMLNYESKTQMQYIPPNNYVISNDSKLDLNKMIIKASYRDIVMFLKSIEHHNQQMNKEFEAKYYSLLYYSKRKAECERITMSEVVAKKVDKSQNGINSNNKNMINPFSIKSECKISTSSCEDSSDTSECDEITSAQSTSLKQIEKHTILPKESSFQKFKPNDVIIDKGIGHYTVVSQGLQLILIDDHANTFYPFLSIVVQEMLLSKEYLNHNQNIMNVVLISKVLVYNYIAGVWEPLIEKTQVNLEVTKDLSDDKVSSTTINIHIPVLANKPYQAFNINISDMTISFLYSTMNSWIEKYFKLKNNYSEEIKRLLQHEKSMNITNHTVFNFTGRPMRIYRVFKDNRNTFNGNYKKLSEVAENQSFEIEYFDDYKDAELHGDVAQSLLKENYVCFELNDAKVNESLLKIDNMQNKTHSVNYSELRRKIGLNKDSDIANFDYVVSQIKFKNLRKFIYFYSPLSFKNKTGHSIIISLKRKGLSNFFMFLDPKKTVGVPIEYMDGEVHFIFEDSEPKVFSAKKFLTNSIIQEELNFNKKCFGLLHKNYENSRNKIITINNSYCIRNCLPFDIQVVVMKTKEVHQILRGGKIFTDALSVNDNLTLSIFFLQFRTAKEVILYNTKDKDKKATLENSFSSFTMIDDKGFPLTICATMIKGDTKTFVLHPKGVIINNTLLDVKFYYGKDTKKAIEVAGQKEIANVFLLSDEKYMILECNGFLSQPFNIIALGVSSVIECRKKGDKEKVIEFVMESNLSLLAQDLDLYSNIITFSPRFILYNQVNHPILVTIYNDRSESELLRTCEKKAFYFFDKGPKSLISIRIMEIETEKSGSKWNWSEPISLLADSLLTVQINSSKGLVDIEKKFINLEKKIEGASTFIVITETSYENCQFYIENYSSNVCLKIWQQNYEKTADYVDIRSKTIFAWTNYKEKNILCVQFFIGSIGSRPLSIGEDDIRKYLIEDDNVTFIPCNNNFNNDKEKNILKVYPAIETIKLKTSMYGGFAIKAKICTDGMRKSIIFTDITHEVARLTNQLTSLYEVNLRIEKFGISIIGDNKNLEGKKEKYRRFEAVFITFKEILFYYKRQIIENEIKSDMQLKIIEMEVDNQYSYISHFPIIMRPINSNKYKKDEMQLFPPFFNLAISLQRMKNEDTTKILLLNYLIQSFFFTIDSNVVVALINFFQNLTKEMKTSVTNINPVFIDNKINLENGIFIKENYFDPTWLQKTFQHEKSKLFIQRLETSPIDIMFSFITQSKDKVFQKILQSNPFFSTFLSTISNVENVPIMLNGSQMNNIYGNLQEIISNIVYIYQQSVLLQVMKMFGAIDILGNPLNLLHNLGTGVKDFFQKPIKGIVKGPLEGAKGVIDGSLSLVKHTVEGTFTTTSKITSGISKGILYITQDDEYINEREKKKITEKPKNFVEGIGYGLSSMAGGIFYGVTDIVMKPIQGAQKDKWAGFGKGIMKGLAGVVVKPISGVLELVSKTTEGIKNTVNNDDKFKIERLPRPFYGKFKFIKSYNAYHAQVIEILNNRIEHFKNHSVDFYSSEIYRNQKEDNILIVFSTTSMYIIDVSRRELKSVLHYTEIKDLSIESKEKIRIYFKREINGKSNSSITLSKNNSSATQIFNKIKDAMDNNYEERPISFN